MGASGWAYFTPYQPDIQKALDALRQQVFESGEYNKAYEIWQHATEEGIRQWFKQDAAHLYDPAEVDDLVKRAITRLREMKARTASGTPSSPEEAVAWNEDAGTHSILDVHSVTDDPSGAWFVAAPLTENQLMMILGSIEPTHDQIVVNTRRLWNLRERWEATYIIVYKDGKPNEIYFTGFSGD
jgi:hypothetical protein